VSIVLLDTNVVSFIMDARPLAEEYLRLIGQSTPLISFMTVGELYEGAYRAKWGSRRFRRLIRALEDYPVLQSSVEISQRWGEIRTQRKRRPISTEDAWIAATALAHGCPLVTHNPKDFEDIPDLAVVTAIV